MTGRPQISFGLLLAAIVAAGCAAAEVGVGPDAPRVQVGSQAPAGPHEQLGAVTAQHGGGCGVYGTRGNYEGAFTLLRNKAAKLGADYVQILRVTEPHLEGICMNQAFVIDGIAYKMISGQDIGRPAVAGRPAYTPPPARPQGLNGTYTGEITGNTSGRVFTTRITFTIVQDGDQIVGTFTTTAGTIGTVKGVLTESGIREWTARQLKPCLGEYGGVAVIEGGGLTLTGSYVGSDCEGSLTASFAVTRQ